MFERMMFESVLWAIYSDGSNNVRSSMFDRSKPKIGCSSSITIRWTRSSSFDVRKNDVRVSSMSNLVNIVRALLRSKFDVRSFEAKNREWVKKNGTENFKIWKIIEISFSVINIALVSSQEVSWTSANQLWSYVWII